MSTTQIDYLSVVQELEKGLQPVKELTGATLREYRTIYIGTGRQRGLTALGVSLVLPVGKKALVLAPNIELIYKFRNHYADRYKEINGTHPNHRTDTPHYVVKYPDGLKSKEFEIVIIDDSSHYFSRFNMNKVYDYLAECTCSDVVIYRLR